MAWRGTLLGIVVLLASAGAGLTCRGGQIDLFHGAVTGGGQASSGAEGVVEGEGGTQGSGGSEAGGAGGSGGGSAGGGGSISIPCQPSGACPRELVCDEAKGICVQCLGDGDCIRQDLDTADYCDPQRSLCVRCTENSHCDSGEDCNTFTGTCGRRCDPVNGCPQGVCDTVSGFCGRCNNEYPCSNGERCEAAVCFTCRDDSDCPEDPYRYCNANRDCVECFADGHCRAGYYCNNEFWSCRRL